VSLPIRRRDPAKRPPRVLPRVALAAVAGGKMQIGGRKQAGV
jgi:hypothetical protein